MTKITNIHVSFPIGIELDSDDQKDLHDLIQRVCKKNEPDGKSMWIFGAGSKITSMGIVKGDEHIDFDDNIFVLEIAIKNKTMSPTEYVDELIEKEYPEDVVTERIDGSMGEYLNDDWESDFDDQYEAYLETGRGGAESQILREIIVEIRNKVEVKYGQKPNENLLAYIRQKLLSTYDILNAGS